MLHAGRVEVGTLAALVVLRQLQIEALAVQPDDDMADARPGVEPLPQRPQRAVIRGPRKAGEAEGCSQKLAAWVEHVYSMIWSARSSTDCGIVRPNALAVLRLITNSNLVGCSMGKSPAIAPFKILST